MSTPINELPPDHPDRNRPLTGAWYRFPSGSWKDVKPTFGIAKKSYNDLGDSWTENVEWEWR